MSFFFPGFTSRTLYNAIIERTKRYVRPPPSGNAGGSDDEAAVEERQVKAEQQVDVDEDSRAEVDQFFDNDKGPDGVESASTESQATSASSNAPLFSFRLGRCFVLLIVGHTASITGHSFAIHHETEVPFVWLFMVLG